MPPSDDEDALIASLEAATDTDPTLSALRERRIQSLSSAVSAAKAARTQGFGSYTPLSSEKSLLDLTTSPTYPRCIVHFFKSDFNRCSIMDGHLETLAQKHLEARFVRIAVEDAPFLVERLGVRVLPCVIGFVDGVGVERVVGFEGLKGGDAFETGVLEGRLVGKGVLLEVGTGGGVGVVGRREEGRDGEGEGGGKRGLRGRKAVDEDEDDDWD
ncbi:MAG: hypothetical protein OHK93_003650 [Ramalina farinacea]|uniref:Thioredoxin-like protein n=1 Tax=Ramalina farinacea TaxID=258253 RepID=A0AA43TUV1_9LECA|nr:hypothetical protein [Ramalina farinacea]